ncbi:MAG: aminopeptidase [Niabella sp.]|nr:MAG: aminopeptidase [Niabella sp.]
MNTILLFDLKSYKKNLRIYWVVILLIVFGWFAGTKANLSVAEGVFINSAYSVGYLLGLLSLSIIFIASIIGTQLLFKERDNHFFELLFSTTLTNKHYTTGRFLSFVLITFCSFLLLTLGFMTGQLLRSDANIEPEFKLVRYLYPLLIFGVVNTFFVCSLLSLVAWGTNSKLMVAAGGLFLYVMYMVVLVFSSSPFMAQSMPQSLETQYLSAVADPFGLSAYFFESRNFSVIQRNTVLTPLKGSFLINRLIVILLSFSFLIFGKSFFKVATSKCRQRKNNLFENHSFEKQSLVQLSYQTTHTRFKNWEFLKSVISFSKTDLIYIFRNIPFAVISILLLFFLGMEMYAEIEKGIRLPQRFASSGLMASTILENFHLLGIFIVVFYANDLFCRSQVYGFSMFEEATFFSSTKLLGHWISISLLILYFSFLAIVLGLIFQLSYHYIQIDFEAYWGVIVFNSLPLMLLTGFVLLINNFVRQKYFALGISFVLALLVGPFAGKVFNNPLFRFFTGFSGLYSDFNGYGPYLISFCERWFVGFCFMIFLFILIKTLENKKLNWKIISSALILMAIAVIFSKKFLADYKYKDKQNELELSSNYEKKFRKYQKIPQPVITKVYTKIHLFPSQNRYEIEGIYTLTNKSDQPVNNLLIDLPVDFEIKKLTFKSDKETIQISEHISELILKQPIAILENAFLEFKMSYSWKPINGHQSFNAIVNNGSFMRISRYYPQIGYQQQKELVDENVRKQFGLGEATPLKRLEEPLTDLNDLTMIDMTVDTENDQIAIGTGELIKEWKDKGRNYFQYRTPQPVPFRFAVSSARYKTKSIIHDSIRISVYYHPKHKENVDHLLRNARLTLDYCRKNFGPYQYNSVSFAEVSSFTKGFAATAYPATIFMTENMTFHANIKSDRQQDVINELAGHELSHLWWGDNQTVPDEREGAAMLTETLAMYTEMMLYKKMHGRKRMLERVKVHQQIFDSEKGFSHNDPLFKVSDGNPHIAYSKGAVAMVQLSEIIGEDSVNKALRNFLIHSKQAGKKPTTLELLKEIYLLCSPNEKRKVEELFTCQ